MRTPRAIDLSQPLDESTVLWPGSRPVRAETVSDLEADGYYTRALRLPEHSGTHLDALPARGALLVVGALSLVGGSGAPARVFALVPEAGVEARRGAG